MKVDDALWLVRNLQRFSDRSCSKFHPRGQWLGQVLIPLATGVQNREADKIGNGDYTVEYRTIPLSKIVSGQEVLYFRNLMWQLRRFTQMQKKKPPTVVKLPDGFFYLWDGNHRTTTGVILGAGSIRVKVLKKPKKKVKRG